MLSSNYINAASDYCPLMIHVQPSYVMHNYVYHKVTRWHLQTCLKWFIGPLIWKPSDDTHRLHRRHTHIYLDAYATQKMSTYQLWNNHINVKNMPQCEPSCSANIKTDNGFIDVVLSLNMSRLCRHFKNCAVYPTRNRFWPDSRT